MPDDKPYGIEASDSYSEAFAALDAGHQERIVRLLREHVRFQPTARYPGLKELRGAWRGHYQFMVSASRGIRLVYRVDEDSHVVRIEYLGSHPSWSRSRDAQNL
ncbi:MAG: hypothetical protein WEB13_01975 [Dehalococcoidia bacterium]